MPAAAPGFENDVKPYFTQVDREHMVNTGLFDLWDLDQVKENFDQILDALMTGRMPRPTAWPQDKRDKFEQVFTAWRDGGYQP